MIYVITGPTGTGKSQFAVDIATMIGGHIINADAFQVYRQMNIGTNKITKEETKGITHHLIDIVNPDEPYNVATYQKQLRQTIQDLNSKNIPIIITGGTGLYIKAGLYDFHFPNRDKKIDTSDLDYYSKEKLHAYLTEIDPDTAKTIHLHNRRRVLRAIEIYRESGITKSQHLAEQKQTLLYPALFIGFSFDRQELYQKVDKRVDKMFADGLVDEVKNLINKYNSHAPGFQAIGYKEVIEYLNNKCSLTEAIDNVKIATRRYIKRQMSYFNHQLPLNWFDDKHKAQQYIQNFVNKK